MIRPRFIEGSAQFSASRLHAVYTVFRRSFKYPVVQEAELVVEYGEIPRKFFRQDFELDVI